MKKLSSLLLFSAPLLGQPQLDSVAHGNATLEQHESKLVIHASDQAILNFRSFDIQKDESVRFQMQQDTHRVLNRIDSSRPSHIEGRLSSNGIVYLLNPAGVVFGPLSTVNVGSLIVAAAHLSDQDFLKGIDHFTSIKGNIEVLGQISAQNVKLIGVQVLKQGSIDAKSILYAVGNQVYLGKEGDHLFIKCEKNHLPDDQPFLASGTAESFLIYHAGVSKSDSIHFKGEKGSKVHLTGTLDVSQDGVGGNVIVQGETIHLRSPTIDASGTQGGGTIYIGGGPGGKGLSPAALETDVDQGSVLLADATIEGNGGTIIQWADDRCKANGLYSVRGGKKGGDAGMIETSSGNLFQGLTTRCQLDAPMGKAGVWKVDPYSIQIAVGGTATLADLNDGSNNSYTIDPATINAASAGSTVIFAANNSSGHTPGTCFIALGTPSTPANINTTNANVTLIFNTTESPTVRGMMTTNGNINSGTLVFSTPITLTGDTTFAASNITTNFDVNGPWALNLNATSSVICQGSIGNTTSVGSITVTTPSNSGSLLTGSASLSPTCTLHATGNIAIGAALAMQTDTSILSDTGGITFNSSITASTPSAQQNLTLSAAGDILFHGTAGLNPLGDVLIQAADNVHLFVSPQALSSGIPPNFIRSRSFTQLTGTGDSLFEGSIITTGVPFITRASPQNGGAVYINTTGNINFYYLTNVGGFPAPVLSYSLPTRPYYKSVINTTGARTTFSGPGFNGGDVTLIGNSVNLIGLYAGGTPAFPGSTFAGGAGGNVEITTSAGLNLRGPIFATGGAGENGGGQVLPTLIFGGQNLNAPGPDSPGNITITGPVTIGFNGVVLRGQNIQAESMMTGASPDLLAIDGSTNGQATLGSLSNLSYFVVDYSKGVKVLGPTTASGIALFNSGSGGIVFEGPVTAQQITAIENRFDVTFVQGYTAAGIALLNCSETPPSPPSPLTPSPTVSNNLDFAGVYAPSFWLTGDISFDTSTSLFSVLRLFNVDTPFADVFNLPTMELNYLNPPESTDELTREKLYRPRLIHK
ncbi:MAG TPA: filamentous hemagglutinin N-terminal domain-containing protein [Rhabdochlamydiaceae bacterium]|nr:filamentous hemagglutinin N-terminal domain-containing protein [Rhabdochlamydiaceae bacterium]